MLVHKSIDIRPEVWQQARVNAELSGVALRDYLSYLITSAGPVDQSDDVAMQALETETCLNREARRAGTDKE
jgi:macrodomain Ter protein organizer (MatP/YcbG family)